MLRDFDSAAWIARAGRALEDAARDARPIGVQVPIVGSVRSGDYRREQHRRYREMSAMAQSDPFAAKLFNESHLRFDAVPDGIQDLLLEHPVLQGAWLGGAHKGFERLDPTRSGHIDLKSLVSNLAKLSVRTGGAYAATVLHRLLAAGDAVRLHAHEIMVLHGLRLDDPIALGRGAYLASYDAVRMRFGLPENPVLWLASPDQHPGHLPRHPRRRHRSSSHAVLVRPFRWGPALAPSDRRDPADRPPPELRFQFPADHRLCAFEDIFAERDALLHLLSIAVGSKLVSHTTITALPRWMTRLDPNFGTGSPGGRSGPFDVWPEDQVPSARDLDAFVGAARGWLSTCAGKHVRNVELAIRRTAASYGIAGGVFGLEDRIIDASVALEALYGPFGTGEITHKISLRAAWLLGTSVDDRDEIFRDMKRFYGVRSKIVHGSLSRGDHKRERDLADGLALGRELSRRSLFALLDRGPVKHEQEWNGLVLGAPDAARPVPSTHRPET